MAPPLRDGNASSCTDSKKRRRSEIGAFQGGWGKERLHQVRIASAPGDEPACQRFRFPLYSLILNRRLIEQTKLFE